MIIALVVGCIGEEAKPITLSDIRKGFFRFFLLHLAFGNCG
jgi:hypothetical protein